jgi:hypothetical protein
VRWILGFNLGEPVPNHSRLTRIRTRYGQEALRRCFEVIVEKCQQAELVWGEERYFASTQVQADASLDSLTARLAVEARQAPAARVASEARAAVRVAQPEGEALVDRLAALIPQGGTDGDPATTTGTTMLGHVLPPGPRCRTL